MGQPLVERVNRDLRQRAIAEADASIAYLNSELAKTSVVELRESLYRLLENQTKTIMFARVPAAVCVQGDRPGVRARTRTSSSGRSAWR